MPPSPADLRRRNRACWTLVALLLLLQGVLFRQYALREVVWLFPRYFDQAVYLDLSFHSYESMLAEGFLPGLGRSLALPVANGMLLHSQAAVLYLFVGPSRLAALALLFAYFAAFQVVLVATLRHLSGRWSVALYGLGLLLTATAPYAAGAGLTDFRIDFVAFSLFGILLCAVARSDCFASWPWSGAVGGAAALLVLFRYITAVYLAGILGTWWLLTAARTICCRRDPTARARLSRRLIGGLLAGGVLTALALPVLVWKRQALWDYYVGSHVLSSDKAVRAAEAGVSSPLQSYLFYARALYATHAGPFFLYLAAVGGLAAAVARRLTRSRVAGTVPADGDFSVWSFLACSLLVPYAILTLSITKTAAVGGILVPPLLWLALLPVVRLARAGRGSWAVAVGLPVLAGVAVVCGLHVQFRSVCRHDFWTLNRGDAGQVLSLYDEIIRRSRETGLRSPVLSCNRITEYLTASNIRVRSYERDGATLEVSQGLGRGINEVDEATARAELEGSDFVVLAGDTLLACPAYPFHQCIRPMRGWMHDSCERELLPAGRYRVLDTTLELYARPTLRVDGDSHGWITSSGFTLTGTREALQKGPVVCLNGRIDLRLLGRTPRASVVLKGEDGDRELPASFDVSGNRYQLRFTVDPRHLPKTSPVTLTVHFDTYFVPRALGLNDDARQLVVEVPDKVILGH